MCPSFKTGSRWQCAAVFVLVLASCSYDAAGPTSVQPAPVSAEAGWLDSKTGARIDAIFAEQDRVDSPGYAVGIVKDGRLVFAKGYGQANLDDQVPITLETSFHLASLSKQFTAAAIVLLILDSRLSLEDPVSKYVPEAARFGADLRLKHLLYMTSGLPEYMSLPRRSGMPWFSAYYFTRDEAIAATLSAEKLEFAPGTRWAYSNINYMLLTRVVEVSSGERFSAFMDRRIFQPLGMTSTHVDDDSTRIVPHRATGYAPRAPDILEQARSGPVGCHGVPVEGEGGSRGAEEGR